MELRRLRMYEIKDKNRIGLPLIEKIRDYFLTILPTRSDDIYISGTKDSIILYTYWFILRINYPIRDTDSVFITCSSLDEHLNNHVCMVSMFMPFLIEALKINVFGYTKEIKEDELNS